MHDNPLTGGDPQAGFSLIEIILVMAIISLLSAIGSQSLYQWQQRQVVRTNALQLAEFLRAVRRHANRYNQTFTLSVQPGPSHWCVAAATSAAPCQRQPWHWSAATAVQTITLQGEPGFYGKHNSAWPGSIAIGNRYGRWRVIISTQGRIRYCDSEDKECR